MGILDFIDREKLSCTYCGKKPVVAFTLSVEAEINEGEITNGEIKPESVIATCKEHIGILQEMFEKELEGADFVGGVDAEGDVN